MVSIGKTEGPRRFILDIVELYPDLDLGLVMKRKLQNSRENRITYHSLILEIQQPTERFLSLFPENPHRPT